MRYQIIPGDNSATLKSFPDNHFDSIVTDPPYGINFLGKTWDATIGSLETYQECLRVLKPGGHILAFSSARTYHHLAITIEQAGFEIRDQIMWIYSSGFPKSQDVGRSIQRSLGVKEKTTVKGGARPSDKQTGGRAKDKIQAKQEYSTPVLTDPEAKAWAGWGTQLKPAHEPIVLARKPIKLSIAKNCQTWGVGALNIEATRIPTDEKIIAGSGNAATFKHFNPEENTEGLGTGVKINKDVERWTQADGGRFPSNVIGEIPDYQKYFYCPKVSRRERHVGFDDPGTMTSRLQAIGGYFCDADGNPTDPSEHTPLAYVPGVGIVHSHSVVDHLDKQSTEKGNNHPTVKPIELMKYLIRLVTPTGGHVLDPFTGSGSTGMAAVELDYEFTGCELDPAYIDIAHKRIQAWYQDTHPNMFSKLFIND